MVLADLGAQGKPLPPDGATDFPVGERRTVIGSVAEDDSTVQVVYRRSLAVEAHGEQPVGLGIFTVRRTPAGWGLWTAERDISLLAETDFSFVWGLDDEVEKRLGTAADEVVTWPAGTVPSGRAFVTGYPGGMRPPKALVVEAAGADGRPTRVKIPASAFDAVMEKLLMPWVGLEEEAPPPARP